jgi:predicted DNA-binding protein (UPF0278 family)
MTRTSCISGPRLLIRATLAFVNTLRHEVGRKALYVARDAVPVSTEETYDLHATEILAQSIVDFLQTLLRRIRSEYVQLVREQNI